MNSRDQPSADLLKQIVNCFVAGLKMGEAQYQPGVRQTRSQGSVYPPPETAPGDAQPLFDETGVLGEFDSLDILACFAPSYVSR